AVNGKQTLLLAPTTILAEQHWNTFRERYRDFPVIVEMVSRFRKPAEAKRILADFAAGKVDVLVGTHRVLSRDVIPKELGLVILDEEQRFGVAQKELLRSLRLEVDVLALSATPIPRTLHMSLSGLRDISIIETPPEGRRPIRTTVDEYDEELVKIALDRERAREGQSFYLHNRVETIGARTRTCSIRTCPSSPSKPAPAWPRSLTTPSWARASPSRCATSRSAAQATCSVPSSRGTSRRSGSSCTSSCSARQSRSSRAS